MKFRGIKFDGNGCDIFNVVFGMCEIYNEKANEEAFDEYLKSEQHNYATLTIPFNAHMHKEIRALKSGKLSPTIPFICCRGCFEGIFSSSYHFTYAAIEPSLEENDPKWQKVDIKSAPLFEETAALGEFLTDKAHSEYTTSYCSVSEDRKDLKTYLTTFRKLMTEAAKLAKRINATDCALNLLEAISLTYTLPPIAEETPEINFKPIMNKDAAGLIYEKAVNGWKRLWAAVELTKLKV